MDLGGGLLIDHSPPLVLSPSHMDMDLGGGMTWCRQARDGAEGDTAFRWLSACVSHLPRQPGRGAVTQASCGTGVEEEAFECRGCCLVVADRERLAALPAAFSAAFFTGAEARTFFLRRENATASSTCSGTRVTLIVMSTRRPCGAARLRAPAWPAHACCSALRAEWSQTAARREAARTPWRRWLTCRRG